MGSQPWGGSDGGSICVKYEQESKVDHTYHANRSFPSDHLELTVIKYENNDFNLVEHFKKTEDPIVEFSHKTSPVIKLADQKNEVMLETISNTKTEAEIIGDDESPFSSDKNDDLYNIDRNSDSDWNSDPEVDPFADINCDPSFSQTPQGQNVNDSATNSHVDLSDSFEASIFPSATTTATTTNTSIQQQLKSSQRKKLDSELHCGLCLENQSSESELQTHVEICATCHKNRHRFCVPCNKLFCLRQKYRHHALRRHGVQVAKAGKSNLMRCQFCPCFFAGKEALVVHLASHPEIKTSASDKERLHLKPYECQDCSSTFSQYYALSSHMKSHKDERDFKCPMPNCEKAFKLNGNLKEHLQRMHSDRVKVKPFKCQEPNCGKTFKMSDQLRKHMVSHSEERPFSCSQTDCGKTFKNQEQLKKHLKAHNGARRYGHITERPFKCEQCERAFFKNWLLTAHLKTHNRKEKTVFKCPQPNCKTTFKYKENIKVHIANIHTNKDVLPFQCPESGCVQRFKYKETLQTHLSTHTGQERPFKCPQPGCSASFNRSTYLNSHLKQKHK